MNEKNNIIPNSFTNPFIERYEMNKAKTLTNPLAGKYERLTAPKRKRKREQVKMLDPIESLSPLVQKYNDYIMANDLNDNLIDVRDYANKNSPSFLNGEPFGINEEKDYLQNQLWRLQNDERYTPDYEDLDSLTDDEYEAYISKLMAPDDNSVARSYKKDKMDKMSDENFTKYLDNAIKNEESGSGYGMIKNNQTGEIVEVGSRP
jgi:hypothetical protein